MAASANEARRCEPPRVFGAATQMLAALVADSEESVAAALDRWLVEGIGALTVAAFRPELEAWRHRPAVASRLGRLPLLDR